MTGAGLDEVGAVAVDHHHRPVREFQFEARQAVLLDHPVRGSRVVRDARPPRHRRGQLRADRADDAGQRHERVIRDHEAAAFEPTLGPPLWAEQAGEAHRARGSPVHDEEEDHR
jgi:hypothetical protein